MKIRRTRRNYLGLCLAAVASLAVYLPASAHDFWVQPKTFNLKAPGTTTMTLQVGHGTARQTSLMTADRVTRFDSFSHSGHVDRRKELRLGDANVDTTMAFPKTGLQLLVFETNGTYSELPSIRFNDYAKVEGLTPAIAQRARLKQTDQPGREVYSRRAKALIQVGSYTKADDAIASKAIGMSLEIVPEINPYAPGFKGDLPVRIFYYGKPLAGAKVNLNNLDFDGRPVETMLSDASGRVTFHLPKNGFWQLNVIWTRSISDPKADFETMFSSLTLGFSPA
ncbi:DUF4198 domain-containing protein [Asticcacaulis sp. 201]|uniref:DUF4198 domain-containing protein n=1 Tax=Asticcacaulis sp. 201 TaxID=3028787 RepID=UPI00291676C2|nr:DUF4198 domain-containing protein [Asticcacaulis sp. 201]MDV6331153.1 DUF4198 domain-containing protein [Asticcacaulis sp. 201]